MLWGMTGWSRDDLGSLPGLWYSAFWYSDCGPQRKSCLIIPGPGHATKAPVFARGPTFIVLKPSVCLR